MIILTKQGYDLIRPLFGGKITQSQVDGIERILRACADAKIFDVRHVAYVLATVFHETGKTMRPVEEVGKGKGRIYGQRVTRTGKPYSQPHIYYGRGDVQLTWFDNYKYMGGLIGADLLNKPELALNPEISAKILTVGMKRGAFTGVSLNTYFNQLRTDPVNARKIINGSDCDTLIASYYFAFYKALDVSND